MYTCERSKIIIAIYFCAYGGNTDDLDRMSPKLNSLKYPMFFKLLIEFFKASK